MIQIELRRPTRAGPTETKSLGVFTEVKAGGRDDVGVYGDGRLLVRFDRQFGEFVLSFADDGEPDLWSQVVIRSA